jgi:hypothetical protein
MKKFLQALNYGIEMYGKLLVADNVKPKRR